MLVYSVTAREDKWQSGTLDLLTNLFLLPKLGVLECITGTCCLWQMHNNVQDSKLNLGTLSVPLNKKGQLLFVEMQCILKLLQLCFWLHMYAQSHAKL